MALVDSGKFWVGIAVGALAARAVPRLGSSFGDAARPLVKTLMKVCMVGAERGREILASVREVLEDAAAEAQAELRAGRDGGGKAAAHAATAPEPGKSGRRGVGSA